MYIPRVFHRAGGSIYTHILHIGQRRSASTRKSLITQTIETEYESESDLESDLESEYGSDDYESDESSDETDDETVEEVCLVQRRSTVERRVHFLR